MYPDYFRDDVFRIETRRLWLRWPTAADGAAIERYVAERDVVQYMRIPHPYPAGGGAAFVVDSRRRNLVGEWLGLTLALKQKPAASIGFVSVDGPGDLVELGYWLGQPYWGMGLMSEAVAGLLDMIWLATDIERVQADVADVNPRSRRVLEKTGFVAEGADIVEAPAQDAPLPATRFALRRPRPRFGALSTSHVSSSLSACGVGL